VDRNLKGSAGARESDVSVIAESFKFQVWMWVIINVEFLILAERIED